MKTLRLVPIFLAIAQAAACASNIECVSAEGHVSGRAFLFSDTEIRRDQPVTIPVSFSCNSRYELWFGFRPKDGIQIGTTSDGKPRYYTDQAGDDGMPYKRYLTSHQISFKIEVSSIRSANNSISHAGTQDIKPNEFGFSPVDIRIPSDFSVGEKLIIQIGISAPANFYEDYSSLWALLRAPMH